MSSFPKESVFAQEQAMQEKPTPIPAPPQRGARQQVEANTEMVNFYLTEALNALYQDDVQSAEQMINAAQGELYERYR